MYSAKLLERFLETPRAGDLDPASAVGREGNRVCGDVVEIRLSIAGGVIAAARFRTLGCAVAIAASDAVCELATGRSPTGASVIAAEEVASLLGGLPEERASCAAAPLAALRSALEQLQLAEEPASSVT